jgi:SNF2 family DNA or RNA helicase
MESSKLAVFLELVTELSEGRHRALVFSQFVDLLALVRAALDAKGITYQYLDGSTKPKDRTAAVDAFQAGEGELFLISLRAGGFGLNLTAADYVIHLDPWWNPAVESQASDRAHRIGQTRPVTVYRLVAAGTIEERIMELHRKKRDLADSVLDDTGRSATLSVDELRGLLDGD